MSARKKANQSSPRRLRVDGWRCLVSTALAHPFRWGTHINAGGGGCCLEPIKILGEFGPASLQSKGEGKMIALLHRGKGWLERECKNEQQRSRRPCCRIAPFSFFGSAGSFRCLPTR